MERKFASGAKRDSRTGKGRYDLISPIAARRRAIVAEKGGYHYGDRNWEKGMPVSQFLDSTLRHVFQFLEGLRDEDHLAQAGWNLDSAIHILEKITRGELPKELDDLPRPTPPPAGTPAPPGYFTDDDPDALMECFRPDLPPSARRRFYVAGPMTAKTGLGVFQNVLAAVQIGDALIRKGHLVYVPHAATVLFHWDQPYEYFMELDFSLMRAWATDFFLIGPSPGANRELAEAKRLDLGIWTQLDDVPTVESCSSSS